MTDLRSAPAPGPREDDHVRGPADAPLVIAYADFSCPRCAVAWERLREGEIRLVFRHFALRTKHPRAVPLALAAEAAACQGRFWELHDRLYADQGRQDDPHLWAHVQDLGLDLDRFEADRRSDAVAARVRAHVTEALRAGVTATPTLVVDGTLHPGAPERAWLRTLRRPTDYT
ncbi:DsbA family protein [Paraconexibacter algicola]|uniref:Disulfide bond formation protein DsbA n=1 Tax=Paraconexibacter algicola TaxID=2133960 RepID=A0A2T4UCH5_9ACTN|nr:thioredoxin domain-containing protein [Paraconexibacter algicola]PTL54916.1 disulfide bond formation protein DsbA [Paraconexibacter algicola]